MCFCVSDCYGTRNGGLDLRKRWTSGLSLKGENSGHTHSANPWSLGSVLKCLTGMTYEAGLGWSARGEKRWWKLDVPCASCRKHVTFKSGVICANYGTTRGAFRECRGAWCADCFVAHDLDSFETAVPRDFNGASLAEVEDEIRFRKARPGDHLCCPFQCGNCQSINLRGRPLEEGVLEDEIFLATFTRCQLDSFWDRATSTVSSHVREAIFTVGYAELLDIPYPYPALGPYTTGEHLGMLQAMMVVMRSREPGKGGGTVKFGTARHQRSTYTVIWESSPESGSDISLSTGKRGRYFATCNPSEGRWFQQFIGGCRARMGDITRQDRAFTLAVLHQLLEMYEEEFHAREGPMRHEAICACMFLLVACLGGMRGFEVVWTDLAALRYDVEYCEDLEDYTAVSWPVVGRFKAHDGIAGCYMIPIAGTTNSGIKMFVWTQRFLNHMRDLGFEDGWAFRRPDGMRAKASDYRKNIFTKLEVIQRKTLLIDPECNVWEDYGIQRSGRRMFTTEATKAGVEPHKIELQARWQTDRAAGERTVQRSMIHMYSEVRNMKDTLIEPSKKL